MVAIAHIERFITNNPLLFASGRAEQVLAGARFLGRDPIASGQAGELLGEDASTLFHLIETDLAYIKISCEQIGLGAKNRSSFS